MTPSVAMLGPVFHHGDFDAADLARLKRQSGDTVSLCLPARNEAETLGAIVSAAVTELVDTVGLVDEVVVMDDGSTDATAEVAAGAGARVVPVASVLPDLEDGSGKGNALWKSLHVTRGDLVVWLDADLRGFGAHFVVGLLGPLLTRPAVSFVKAFYDRSGEGGRVTELVARPLISRFFPHLAGIAQPLGGEYAGRRSLLEELPFVMGWGVELGLLVDTAERAGPQAIAQVDLEIRRHRNRPLDDLGPQAMAVLVTALRRAGVDGSEAEADADALLRAAAPTRVERVPVETGERPPIVDVPAYRRLRERSA